MDWQVVGEILIVLLAATLLCAVWVAPWWRTKSTDDAEVRQLLKRLGVVGDDENIRALLLAEASRRRRWGAYGGAACGTTIFVTTMLAHVIGIGDAVSSFFAVLLGAGGVYGMYLGHALSALFRTPRSSDGVRVSALQPHGMSDYVHGAQIALETVLAVLGWTSVVVSGSALLGWINLYAPKGPTVGVALVGALLAVPPSAALLLQRSMLSHPFSARDRDELIVADVVLALGLSDIFAAGVSVSGPATIALALTPDRPWWLVWVYAAATCLLIPVMILVRGRRELAPVAHRLSAEEQVA